MLLNLDQLEKQIDKEKFQEIGSCDAFRVPMTLFQTFIYSWFSLNNDNGLMIGKYFIPHTRFAVQQFRGILIQHMESIKKSIEERVQHQRDYDSRVNERHMQSKEGKPDTSSRSGNDTHAKDADIKPANDKEPKAKISKGYRISPNKSFDVHEKPNTPRSCLRWEPTGRIFKTLGLRWIPTGKMFIDSTTIVDNEPLNGSNEDITNPYECEQTLTVSAGTLNLSAGNFFNPKEERLRVWLLKKLMSKNQVPQTTLQAPLLKEKKGVRSNVLYL
nr:hypothetical protein [Tanacetum cinerariifolium]